VCIRRTSTRAGAEQERGVHHAMRVGTKAGDTGARRTLPLCSEVGQPGQNGRGHRLHLRSAPLRPCNKHARWKGAARRQRSAADHCASPYPLAACTPGRPTAGHQTQNGFRRPLNDGGAGGTGQLLQILQRLPFWTKVFLIEFFRASLKT
jgi:hypothetical protein